MKALSQRFLIVALLVAGGFCFLKALPGLLGDASRSVDARTTAMASQVGEATQWTSLNRQVIHGGLTMPIQDLRVGMRVVGRNPLDEDAQRDLPQPLRATWRLVRARIEIEPGTFCDLELLRPLEWIAGNAAEPGAIIWLELPDMLVSGDAEILAIDACPPLETGRAPMITGTFRHVSENVVDMHVDGGVQPIGCTAQHPFWSGTRDDFIPASELEVGEDVLTAYGNSARITSIVPRAGPHTVYGLEIYGEHVYHVGDEALLAHNASTGAKVGKLKYAQKGTAARFTKTNTPWQRTVHQRSDIDWDLVRPDGLTNRQAARQGYAPMRVNPKTGKLDDVVLHHLNDSPRGGVAEMWRSTHGRFHKTMSRDPNPWRTERPDWSQAWNNEQSAYWRWRSGAYNPTPTDRLRLPGDP